MRSNKLSPTLKMILTGAAGCREDAMLVIMLTGTGYEIDLFGGMLYLRPLENGEYAVGEEAEPARNEVPAKKGWEKCFKDPRDAIALFEKERKHRKLGLEYEWGREERWKSVIGDSYAQKELVPFMKAASKDPLLSDLYPFFSHEALGFSEVSVYPFTQGYPFVVADRQRRLAVQMADFSNLGRGNIAQAIKIVKATILKARKDAS